MYRTCLVTGSASGIGKVTAQLLRERGNTVIGVDLRDSDITIDLTTADGRAGLVRATTELSHGSLDAVLAIAGVSTLAPVTVAMNFFGTLATLQGLRPLLSRSPAPRAVAVTSMVSLFPVDDHLVELMTVEDEPAALARAAELATTEAGANLALVLADYPVSQPWLVLLAFAPLLWVVLVARLRREAVVYGILRGLGRKRGTRNSVSAIREPPCLSRTCSGHSGYP